MNNNIIKYFILFLVISTLAGCAGSFPRFNTKETSDKPEPKITKQHRFASEVVKEETAEDDKKIDIPSVRDKILKSKGINKLGTTERDKVLTEIMSMLGTPYSYGGNTDKGIDCSGFSNQIYEKSFNYRLPRSTDEQYRIGNFIEFPDIEFGDLVFFNTTGRSPSHVGIYLGDDLFAHASMSFGVTISSLQSSYYKKRYIGARRVLD